MNPACIKFRCASEEKSLYIAYYVDTARWIASSACGLLAMTLEYMKKNPAVYIMASQRNGTLYAGVTSNLIKRVYEHRQALSGFTAKYGCKMLVWYEQYEDMENAIRREKQIKAGSRKKKTDLIVAMNPHWNDLYDAIV